MRAPLLLAEYISTGIETSDRRSCPFHVARDGIGYPAWPVFHAERPGSSVDLRHLLVAADFRVDELVVRTRTGFFVNEFGIAFIATVSVSGFSGHDHSS